MEQTHRLASGGRHRHGGHHLIGLNVDDVNTENFHDRSGVRFKLVHGYAVSSHNEMSVFGTGPPYFPPSFDKAGQMRDAHPIHRGRD